MAEAEEEEEEEEDDDSYPTGSFPTLPTTPSPLVVPWPSTAVGTSTVTSKLTIKTVVVGGKEKTAKNSKKKAKKTSKKARIDK
jgi:hypothetical protein